MRPYKSLHYWTKVQTFHFSRFSMKEQTLVFLFASYDYSERKCDSVERSKLKEGETGYNDSAVAFSCSMLRNSHRDSPRSKTICSSQILSGSYVKVLLGNDLTSFLWRTWWKPCPKILSLEYCWTLMWNTEPSSFVIQCLWWIEF